MWQREAARPARFWISSAGSLPRERRVRSTRRTLRLDGGFQGHQVRCESANFVFGEISPWLDRIRLERLRIPQPRFGPSRREPVAGVVQVWPDVATSAADGVARLALVLHFVELLAHADQRRSELPRIHALRI